MTDFVRTIFVLNFQFYMPFWFKWFSIIVDHSIQAVKVLLRFRNKNNKKRYLLLSGWPIQERMCSFWHSPPTVQKVCCTSNKSGMPKRCIIILTAHGSWLARKKIFATTGWTSSKQNSSKQNISISNVVDFVFYFERH